MNRMLMEVRVIKGKRSTTGLTCLGPFGAKPCLNLLDGNDAIMILISYNAIKACGSGSSRSEGAFT
jgi:hypothetical protein